MGGLRIYDWRVTEREGVSFRGMADVGILPK